MGDRIAVQVAGKLEQIGTPFRVFAKPATRGVAEFLGQTDFLPGVVVLDGIKTEIGLVEQPVHLPPGSAVEIATRADDVGVEPDPASSARVVARHFRGVICVVRIRLGSGRIVHSIQPHLSTLAVGASVRAFAAPGHPLPYYAR